MQPILPLPHAPAVPLITHQHLQQDEQAPVFSAPAAKKKKKSLRKIEEAVSSQQERFAYFMRYKYWRYPSLTQTDFELKRICDSWGLITAGEYRPTELETHRIVQEAQKKREYDQEEVRIHLELEKQGHQARERKEKERKEQYEREQEEALKLLELRKHAQEERKRKKKEVQLQRQREQEEARTLLEIEKQAQEQEARIQFNQACTNDLIQLLNNSTLDEKKILHFKRTYKSILEHSQDEKVKLIMQGIVKGKQYTYDAVPILRVIAKKEGVTVSSYLNKEAFHQWNVACVDRLMQDVYDFLFCGPHKRNAFEFQHDYTQKCAQVLEKATPLLRELNIVADSFLDFLSQLRAKLVNITNYSLLNGKQNPQALCTLHTVFKKAYRVLRPDEELSTLFENICKTIVEQGVEFCAQESGIESIIILGAPASGKERESYKNMLNAIVCTNQFDEVLCSYGKA
jgi:chemotaxis protein histidine kinase CheA